MSYTSPCSLRDDDKRHLTNKIKMHAYHLLLIGIGIRPASSFDRGDGESKEGDNEELHGGEGWKTLLRLIVCNIRRKKKHLSAVPIFFLWRACERRPTNGEQIWIYQVVKDLAFLNNDETGTAFENLFSTSSTLHARSIICRSNL